MMADVKVIDLVEMRRGSAVRADANGVRPGSMPRNSGVARTDDKRSKLTAFRAQRIKERAETLIPSYF